MIVTTLTGKHQTTIGMDLIKDLGLKPGARLKQSRLGGGIFIEPIGDVMSAFGAFKSFAKTPIATIQEETEAAERGMAEDAMKSTRNE